MEQEDKETDKVKEVPFLRYFHVFHIDQCEGITAKHSEPLTNSGITADEAAETIISDYLRRSGVTLLHEGGDQAFYQPATDSITLPNIRQFDELIHSTGHPSRLNRLENLAFFGSDAYSKEELVAEIGDAALVNHTGLETPDSFRNNAAYLQNWLQVLKDDKRFLVSAASKAEKGRSMDSESIKRWFLRGVFPAGPQRRNHRGEGFSVHGWSHAGQNAADGGRRYPVV